MITFDLLCEKNHHFEGWFRNREECERQMAGGLVSCPLCGSTHVSKKLSAVAVHVARRSTAPTRPSPVDEVRPEEQTQGKPFFQALAQFVEKHFEDVGSMFADEARKIDRGEAEARNIRGTTTPHEEDALQEEGIEFLKIPFPKYDA